MPVGQTREIEVFLGAEADIPVRLILHKLPPEISARIRRKLKNNKQNKRKGLTKERLAFCDVNAYITNIAPEHLGAESAKTIYKLRWQIEIVFKCWKSHFGIDKTPNCKPERIECCILGQLIAIALATKFFWTIKIKAWNIHAIEISELKAFALLRDKLKQIQNVMIERKLLLENFIRDLWRSLTQNARKDRKKGRYLPSDIMDHLGLG